ncbi:MAG: DUF2461 domain-containing protein [Odoribacteraceae bacterium]|jgi:uncharacterized protein (TIGR02453 family)|nr:DUF2461 domain-containing protein [Odoribacteraceae bacterium]
MKNVIQFLGQLAENNTREWFQANKPLYLEAKATYDDFAARLLARIAAFDPEIEGVTLKESLFRIYRDTRFTADKRPYKTHMGAFMARGGKTAARGGYYLHVEPGNSLLAGGIWCPDSTLLKALRRDVFDNVEEFEAIVRAPEFLRHYHMDDGYKLKRVPPPFPVSAPAAEWTKLKSYTAWSGITDDFFDAPDALEQAADRLQLLLPFNQFLNYTVDESARVFTNTSSLFRR